MKIVIVSSEMKISWEIINIDHIDLRSQLIFLNIVVFITDDGYTNVIVML